MAGGGQQGEVKDGVGWPGWGRGTGNLCRTVASWGFSIPTPPTQTPTSCAASPAHPSLPEPAAKPPAHSLPRGPLAAALPFPPPR